VEIVERNDPDRHRSIGNAAAHPALPRAGGKQRQQGGGGEQADGQARGAVGAVNHGILS